MTTEIEETPVEPVEETEDAGLRAHNKQVEAENKDLRKQVLSQHIAAIGLSTEEGLGIAVFEGYKGEFTEEAVAAFAEEKYGHKFESGEPAAPAAEELESQEKAVTAVQQSSQPVTPPTKAGEIAELDTALADPDVDGPVVAAIAIERKLQGYVSGEYRGKPLQT